MTHCRYAYSFAKYYYYYYDFAVMRYIAKFICLMSCCRLRTRTCLRLVLNALLEFVCFSCGMLSMFVCSTGTPQDVFPDEKVIKSIFGLSNEVSRSSEWSKEEQIENQYNL